MTVQSACFLLTTRREGTCEPRFCSLRLKRDEQVGVGVLDDVASLFVVSRLPSDSRCGCGGTASQVADAVPTHSRPGCVLSSHQPFGSWPPACDLLLTIVSNTAPLCQDRRRFAAGSPLRVHNAAVAKRIVWRRSGSKTVSNGCPKRRPVTTRP